MDSNTRCLSPPPRMPSPQLLPMPLPSPPLHHQQSRPRLNASSQAKPPSPLGQPIISRSPPSPQRNLHAPRAQPPPPLDMSLWLDSDDFGARRARSTSPPSHDGPARHDFRRRPTPISTTQSRPRTRARSPPPSPGRPGTPPPVPPIPTQFLDATPGMPVLQSRIAVHFSFSQTISLLLLFVTSSCNFSLVPVESEILAYDLKSSAHSRPTRAISTSHVQTPELAKRLFLARLRALRALKHVAYGQGFGLPPPNSTSAMPGALFIASTRVIPRVRRTVRANQKSVFLKADADVGRGGRLPISALAHCRTCPGTAFENCEASRRFSTVTTHKKNDSEHPNASTRRITGGDRQGLSRRGVTSGEPHAIAADRRGTERLQYASADGGLDYCPLFVRSVSVGRALQLRRVQHKGAFTYYQSYR
ncbi:hypothetical protein BC827DRAFT_1316849 [Russula dissimulans]|nr:hypothetical protein BC827DRAFT_1316849 [Russula dissimulans]